MEHEMKREKSELCVYFLRSPVRELVILSALIIDGVYCLVF